jgi:hypothetical protein
LRITFEISYFCYFSANVNKTPHTFYFGSFLLSERFWR